MPLIIPSSSISGGYVVDNSLRFDDGSSDYLTHSFSTPTDNKKHTISFWAKRTVVGISQFLFAEGSDSNNTARIFFSTDGLRYVSTTSNIDDFKLVTNQVFRDVSAWYHIVITVDTTQATADDRIKMYVNGQQITSFATRTNPSINLVTRINSSGTHTISGRGYLASDFYDGYLAEFVFIDGQALDSTSFGEFDSDSGIWKPIDVSGLTFGTNGFYLPFENSGALGQDDSGNANNFTVNNLTSIDQTTDTPTNNYCTMNPLSKGSDITVSNGNLSISNGISDNSILGNIGFANGKWYWEAKCTSATTYANIGVTLASKHGGNHSDVDSGRVVYSNNGYVYREGLSGQSDLDTGTTFTTNDIVSVAYDGQNGSVKFYKNGTLINTTTDTDLLFSNNEYIVSCGLNQGGFHLNFGNPPFTITSGNSDAKGYGNFEYSVPSGYYSLNTKNLAEFG